jgi:hypothetical protein
VAAARKIKPVGPRVGYPRYEAYGGSTVIERCIQTLRQAVCINTDKSDRGFVQNRAQTRPTDQKHNKTCLENFSRVPKTPYHKMRSVVSGMAFTYSRTNKHMHTRRPIHARKRQKKFTLMRDWVYCYTVNRLFCEVMWKRLEWHCASPIHYGLKITLDSIFGIN